MLLQPITIYSNDIFYYFRADCNENSTLCAGSVIHLLSENISIWDSVLFVFISFSHTAGSPKSILPSKQNQTCFWQLLGEIFTSSNKRRGKGEHHFVTLMKMPCTFWHAELPPGCLLAMKLFHISFIIRERDGKILPHFSHVWVN